jgi:mono/diheme cytochrome c family protein
VTRIPGVEVAASAVLATALAATACDVLPGRPRPAQTPSPVERAGVLYARHCAGCHGADGRLGAARPLADPLYLAWIGEERLRRVSADGVPGSLMPGFSRRAGGSLDDAELDLLVQDVLRRWGGNPPEAVDLPDYATPSASGNPRRGAEVFARYCAECHGADGKGGVRAGAVVDPAYLGLVSDQALRSAVVAGREDLGMPGFDRGAPPGPMDARDVDDVIAWLASQRRER